MSYDDMIQGFARDQIKLLLDQCTPEQQAFFNRIWGSVEKVPEDKLKTAWQQIDRTLAKNNEPKTAERKCGCGQPSLPQSPSGFCYACYQSE